MVNYQCSIINFKFLFRVLSIFITQFLIITSCSTQKQNQTSNSRLYKKDNNELNAHFLVYHLNDSISQLFYDFSNETIVYKKTDTSTYFYSDIKILAEISNEKKLSQVIDTSTVIIKDRQSNVDVKQLKGSCKLNLKTKTNYYISITVFDGNKKTKYESGIYAYKESNDTRQNFLITNKANQIHYPTYYKPNETIYISSARSPESLLTVDYFKTAFNIALPPFSLNSTDRFNYKPDSSFGISLENHQATLNLPSKGFYHLKTNDETKDGVTFLVYEPTFPKIKNEEQMILATRYIMAKKEFDNCMNATNKKQAIDNFWLEIAGNNERARELIKKYYTRVQEANKLFTSYQEGWKTDRGMIYIVFGAPNNVTKRQYGEIWTYGESGNLNAIYYQFTKVINPFTDNDFLLERSDTFKQPWYQAVDLWRQGRVYIDN